MLSLHCDELMEKIEKHEGKKQFIADDYMLDKVLDKIKEITGIEKFNDTNILIDTDDKVVDEIIFKNVMILMACVIKGDGKFYPQIFLEEALHLNKHGNNI